jgi:hypothetical protein
VLIRRFEALGLLPDRILTRAIRVIRNDDGTRQRIAKDKFVTLSITETRKHQFLFGFLEDSGDWSISPHQDLLIFVDKRKAKRFVKRDCQNQYDIYEWKI